MYSKNFFLPMDDIPRTTHQQKGVKVVRGRPYFYTKKEVQDVADFYAALLKVHRPPEPMKGAVALLVGFHFPAKKPHKDGQPKITRPDTDNMLKLIKDVMTDLGYWVDDSQVWFDRAFKVYSDNPGVEFRIRETEPKGRVFDREVNQ